MKREPSNFIAVLEDKKVELSRGIKYKRNSGRKGNIGLFELLTILGFGILDLTMHIIKPTKDGSYTIGLFKV